MNLCLLTEQNCTSSNALNWRRLRFVTYVQSAMIIGHFLFVWVFFDRKLLTIFWSNTRIVMAQSCLFLLVVIQSQRWHISEIRSLRIVRVLMLQHRIPGFAFIMILRHGRQKVIESAAQQTHAVISRMSYLRYITANRGESNQECCCPSWAF